MPPGTRSVFDVPHAELQDWKRSDPLAAEHLQESVTAHKRGPGVAPGSQVLPDNAGTWTGGAAAAKPQAPDVYFRVTNTEWLDSLKCVRWGPVTSDFSTQEWVVMKPWQLWRSRNQWTEEAPLVVEGRRHKYFTHTRRQVIHNLAPSVNEIQNILPPWVTTGALGEHSIITAKRVALGATDSVWQRTGIHVDMNTIFIGDHYTRATLLITNGVGDDMPPKDLWAVLEIRGQAKTSSGKTVLGQITEWDEGVVNPAVTMGPGHGLHRDPDDPAAPVLVDVRWSWRYVADADGRAWAKERTL